MEEDDNSIKAFPLAWPVGRARATSRSLAAPFRRRRSALQLSDGLRRLRYELELFGATNVIVSTNIKPTVTGRLDREVPANKDPGVAVYFRLDGLPHAMSCDKWPRVADNLAAIAAHVEATRGQLRWGAADVAQVFAGFRALPAVPPRKPWWTVLGFATPPASVEVIERQRDELARRHHPDRGGNPNQMAEINAALDEGRRALRGAP